MFYYVEINSQGKIVRSFQSEDELSPVPNNVVEVPNATFERNTQLVYRNGHWILPAVTRITWLGFLNRIPQTERIAIRLASKTDGYIEDQWEMFALTGAIDVLDPALIAFVDYLESESLISSATASELVEPSKPEVVVS